jgi:hypothetical protein
MRTDKSEEDKQKPLQNLHRFHLVGVILLHHNKVED